MSIADKLITVSKNIPKIYEAGKQSESDRFWDSYQQNGSRVDYINTFAGVGWTDDTFKPKYDMSPTRATSMFEYTQLTNLTALLDKAEVKLSLDKLQTLPYRMFVYSKITHCPVLILPATIALDLNCMFYDCEQLITIEGLGTNVHNKYTQTFNLCKSLKNITFTEGSEIGSNISFVHSPLSKESIKSIIKTLSSTITGKTLSLSKTAVNTAFSINVDDETTYLEGSEFYTLRHSKDNWTFSYV